MARGPCGTQPFRETFPALSSSAGRVGSARLWVSEVARGVLPEWCSTSLQKRGTYSLCAQLWASKKAGDSREEDGLGQ
jgi:hypothetical protein